MLKEIATYGTCMRTFGFAECSWVTVDTEAPIVSGDTINIQVIDKRWIIKILRCDRRGRWFLECSDGLVPLSYWSCQPTGGIQKVVGHQPMNPQRTWAYPAGLTASEKAMRVYRALSEDVEEFVDGVAWPGTEAALEAFPYPSDFNERYERQGVASFSAAPPQNPTKPSAVSAFTATSFAGTIEFNWDDPVVRPVGTRFRVMQATVNSYTASSERWLGNVNRALIGMPNTATFYHWLDSVGANGSYSTFPGVSSGVPAAALLTDTNNINPGAVAKIYTDTSSSGPTTGNLNFLVNTVSESGVFEISVYGAISVTSYGGVDDIFLQVTKSGSGSFLGQSLQTFKVNSISARDFPVTFNTTLETAGAGPWVTKVGVFNGGGLTAFSIPGMTLRTTVVRR